jgi:EAL domain-containing protein (putative c-di-GMP-specific phosphodiesterase class I)
LQESVKRETGRSIDIIRKLEWTGGKGIPGILFTALFTVLAQPSQCIMTLSTTIFTSVCKMLKSHMYNQTGTDTDTYSTDSNSRKRLIQTPQIVSGITFDFSVYTADVIFLLDPLQIKFSPENHIHL